jgi:hypothetical protein
MAIDRNVIFLFPLASVVSELKKQLEEDESYTIYEMDSVGEYNQLIGILEQSVTFSTDMKKTSKYLEDNSKFLKTPNAKNYIINSKTHPLHVIGKLQKLGLDEFLKDNVLAKSLLFKVDTFFNQFDAKEEKEKESLQKSVAGMMIMNKNPVKAEDLNKRQHVEKMAILNDEKDDNSPKRKKVDISGLMIGGTELKRRKVTSMEGMLGSDFDNLRRRSVTQFNAIDDIPKFKKSNFKLPVLSLNKKRSNFKEVDQAYGHGSGKKFVSVDMDSKKRGTFKDVEIEARKRNEFVALEQDFKKRKIDFKPIDRDLERKRNAFKEVERESKKGKKFEEVNTELNRKKHNFKEVERDNKKKGSFEEVESELNKKNNKFEEVLPDINKNSSGFKEVESETDKKKTNLSEKEIGLNKKKNKFEEVEADLKKKKNTFKEVEAEKKVKSQDLGELVIGKKKSNQFNDVDADSEKKNNKFDEVEAEKKKKNNKFEEVAIDKSLKGIKNSAESEKNKKNSNFEDVIIERDKIDTLSLNADEDKNSMIDRLLKHDKKDWGEQTIDYRTMRIEQAARKAKLRSEEQKVLDRSIADKLALMDDVEYFYPGTFGIEFLIHYNSYSINLSFENINLLKFIHFSLMKEMDAVVSYFIIENSKPNLVYNGHKDIDLNKYLIESKDYLIQKTEELSNLDLPAWRDESFQEKINEFVYPFYNDGKKYGFAVAHFDSSVTGYLSAKKAELLLMSSKGAILSMASEDN